MSLQGVPGLSRSRVSLLARFHDEGEFVLHRLRHLADHAGAAELGVHAAGPVILDQQRDLVALLDHAVLQMAVGKFRWLAERHRGAEIDAVLAAVALAVKLRGRGHFGIAHAGLHRREGGAHGAVLHQRRALDQFHFLRALDDLDLVDHVGGVNITRLRKRALDEIEHRVGHLIGADITDGGVAERLQRLGGEFGVVVLGVMRRGIARRGHDLLDAAPVDVALRRGLGAAERALAHHRHLVVARKHHRVGIAVGRRHVGEVAHIAAHVIVVVLHQQDVDLFLFHGGAHETPAAFEFGGGDRRVQAFRQSHDFNLPRTRACARY